MYVEVSAKLTTVITIGLQAAKTFCSYKRQVTLISLSIELLNLLENSLANP